MIKYLSLDNRLNINEFAVGLEKKLKKQRRGFTQPEVLDFINQLLDLQSLVSWTLSYSKKFLIGVGGVTRGILGGVFNVILAVLLSGYMLSLSGSKKLIGGIVNLFPHPWDERLEAQVVPISQRMVGYIQGRLKDKGAPSQNLNKSL